MPLPIFVLIVFPIVIIAIPLLMVAHSVQTADERRRKVGRCGFVE